MVSDNRRKFLRLVAGSAGAAGAGLLPGISKALTIPAHNRTGTIQDVEHIVILMQENRSFDHYFGTLHGVRGFGDPRPALLPNGKPVFYQPNNGSDLLPFHPDAPNMGLQFLQDLPHDWTSTHQAWNQGRYDQWVPNKGTTTMAYLTRQDIPYHYALADAFTICDAYHCSIMGPTDPNRYYMWTGWVGNDGNGGGPVIDNSEAGYSWSTYPEQLQAAGISWKIYQDAGTGLDSSGSWGWTSNAYIGNYGDNSLLYFDQYRNAVPGNPLYDRARTGTHVAANPGQSYFDILKQDVLADTLPQVSWIVAPEAYCEHPNWAADYGALYVSQVLEILTSNAELWSKTALFVTFDENDGFFDHMVPPFAPPSREQGLSTADITYEIFPGNSTYAAGPYGLGPRVPMTIVSPWTRGGWVCSQVFDHTSIIQFIEKRFGAGHPGLIEANITPWRRAVCGDLTSAFNFATPNDSVPPLPSTRGYVPPDHNRHPDYVPVPPSTQALPKQEPGLRRARALPYDISVQSRLDNSKRLLALEFQNRGRAGAAFIVNAVGSANPPRSYTVDAGKKLVDVWSTVPAQGVYDLIVSGPNGFLRRFSGDALAAAAKGVAPEVRDAYATADGGSLLLTFTNPGTATVRLSVVTNAYGNEALRTYTLAPGATVEDRWNLKASFGWYDLSVTADASPQFLRRLAGHVETGHASVSDPAIATS
jgi:phospholipase C